MVRERVKQIEKLNRLSRQKTTPREFNRNNYYLTLADGTPCYIPLDFNGTINHFSKEGHLGQISLLESNGEIVGHKEEWTNCEKPQDKFVKVIYDNYYGSVLHRLAIEVVKEGDNQYGQYRDKDNNLHPLSVIERNEAIDWLDQEKIGIRDAVKNVGFTGGSLSADKWFVKMKKRDRRYESLYKKVGSKDQHLVEYSSKNSLHELILSKVILNQENIFAVEDITKVMRSQGIIIEDNEARKVLKNLTLNGIILDEGFGRYKVD